MPSGDTDVVAARQHLISICPMHPPLLSRPASFPVVLDIGRITTPFLPGGLDSIYLGGGSDRHGFGPRRGPRPLVALMTLVARRPFAITRLLAP